MIPSFIEKEARVYTIIVEFTKNPNDVRNEGLADYFIDEEGYERVIVYCKDDTQQSINYAYACMLHELTELRLCEIRGIKEPDIDKFDAWHLENNLDGEPGDNKESPYRKEHRSAEMVERYFIEQCGVHWDDYNTTYVIPDGFHYDVKYGK